MHTEWSWDTGGPQSTAAGRMHESCRRATSLGLSTVAVTEHLDLDDAWRVGPDDLLVQQRFVVDADGYARPPLLDVDGYLDCIERCRSAFPGLRILTGIEFGQPHLFAGLAADLVDLDVFDRVNASLHTLAVDADRAEPNTLFRRWPADDVIRAYLDEVAVMASAPFGFPVVTHLDYPVRSWPTADVGSFDQHRFEDDFRTAMRVLRDNDRVLELNTNELRPWIVRWWAEEGGRSIAFGSDAHTPDELARHFPQAVALAEHHGFRPGTRPEDFWTR